MRVRTAPGFPRLLGMSGVLGRRPEWLAALFAVVLLPAVAHGEPRGRTDDGYAGETAHQRAARLEARCVRKVGDAMALSSDPACFGVLREQVLAAIAALDADAAAARGANSRGAAKRYPPLKSIPTAPWYYGQTR
jgi:hypothetical protein